MRYAIVHEADVRKVIAYLPSNYNVYDYDPNEGVTTIAGTDVAGWTLEDYVIPRFASGLIRCEEVDAHDAQGKSRRV